MGEASRRKDLVESVRKKIGDQAAQALAALEQRVSQLQLQHQAFVFSIEGLRREVSEAKAAPAELRRDVLAFRGDLAMKAEQIENLTLRLAGLQTAITVDGLKLDELTGLVRRGDFDERILAIECFLIFRSFRQRLRWLLTGRLPMRPVAIAIPSKADG